MEECIENGYVKLTVIHLKNDREHLPLIGKVGFFWKTNVFDGYIQEPQRDRHLELETTEDALPSEDMELLS